ncbi:MAG: tetratricopeptide repeat protein [Polyangia bacterium]
MMDQKSRTNPLSSWRSGLCALALLAVSSPAVAAEQSSGDDGVAATDPCLTDNLCKGHYDEARKAYKDKHYDEAFKEYKSAYERRQAPWLLINIGRCSQRLGRNKEALDYYQRYLKADPNPKPETVTRVNGYIDQVKAGIIDEPEAKPEPKPEAKPEPKPEPQPQLTTAQQNTKPPRSRKRRRSTRSGGSGRSSALSSQVASQAVSQAV